MRHSKNLDQATSALIGHIESAFPAEEPPQTLTEGYVHPEEAVDLAAFKGKNWRDLIDADFLERTHSVLPLLSDEAFRYYLPAYLLGCVEGNGMASEWLGTVEFLLYPPSWYASGRMSALLDEQQHAVEHVFDYLTAP